MNNAHEYTSREALLAEALLHPASPHDPSEWWRGAILYEIYIRSFFDTTGSGTGDLNGIIEKLDYLRDLGVDGFWITPFYPSPQRDFGYDISNFCDVDPTYGTLDDFRRLLDEAHQRDLRVLVDFVPCHTSEEHPWFKESLRSRDNPRADWYLWSDGAPDGGPPNNWLSSFGGPAWTWEPHRAQYYFHSFLACQPALNLGNPEVLEAVTRNMRFWLDLGVDGLRMDAVQYLRCDPWLRSNPPTAMQEGNSAVGGGPNNPFKNQFHLFDRDVPQAVPVLETLRESIADYQPERVLIGELGDMDSSRFSVKYTMQGKRLHAIYDFDLINGAHSIDAWKEVLKLRAMYLSSGWTKNVFTNHDSVRAISNLLPQAVAEGRRAEAAKALTFLQATLMGGGILFQGEELGLPQPALAFEDLQDPWAITFWPDFAGRDGVRCPIVWEAEAANGGFTPGEKPWLVVPPEHLPLAVDRQLADPDSVLHFTRQVLHWRREQPVILQGKEKLIEAPLPLIAFERYLPHERLVVVANLGLSSQFLPVPDEPEYRFASDRGIHWEDGRLRLDALAFAAFRVPAKA